MPNPEKERNKNVLHQRLEAAKLNRLPQAVVNGSDGIKSTGSSNSKVLKKPPPNFGGGVLGKK